MLVVRAHMQVPHGEATRDESGAIAREAGQSWISTDGRTDQQRLELPLNAICMLSLADQLAGYRQKVSTSDMTI